MTEHRVVLDPGVLSRLSTSMESIADAWKQDVDQIRILERKLDDTDRLLNAATDRAAMLQGDLNAARERVETLITRNAYLEAQVQNLYENSLDARDVLENLATRAVDAARTAETYQAESPRKSMWRDPEKNPPLANDGTGLPHGPPEFIRRIQEPQRTRLPVNAFPQQAEAAQ